MPSDKNIRQIPLDLIGTQEIDRINTVDYEESLERFRQRLSKPCPVWPHNAHRAASPFPLLISRELHDHQQKFSNILIRAVTSIIERWWTDTSARFPERMPLLPNQETLLQWIDGPGADIVPSFSDKRGAWRTDILFPNCGFSNININNSSSSSPLSLTPPPQICEINARFAFNGFFLCAFGSMALDVSVLQSLGYESVIAPHKILAAFTDLLHLDKPLHILIEDENGGDILIFKWYLEKQLQIKVRVIKPTDLRIVQDPDTQRNSLLCHTLHSEARGGRPDDRSEDLFYSNGNALEPIYQVALELHQRELERLSQEILRALAPICLNDFRSIYLVHDKRMLGIIQQEIESLVHEHKVLTAEEAEILQQAIVPTYLPGSKELRLLHQDLLVGRETKDNFLFKPVSSGKAKGIIFGTDIDTKTFFAHLERLFSAKFEGRLYVVQRLVNQARFDIIVPNNNGISTPTRSYLVGSAMIVDGKELGFGSCRASRDRFCAVRNGGAWICNVVSTPARNIISEQKEQDTADYTLDITRISVSSLALTNLTDHTCFIKDTLQKDGIIIIDLSFSDSSSEYLQTLIKKLSSQFNHGSPLAHSSSRGILWDIKPNQIDSLAFETSVTMQKYTARSETKDEFPWHTDCSYVSGPPRYFGLHVLQADRCGGGTLSVLNLSIILQHLPQESIAALSRPEFRFTVPPEFTQPNDSEHGTIVGPILKQDSEAQWRCRYRADIIKPLTERAENAMKELNDVLEAAGLENGKDRIGRIDLHPEALPDGSVILIDNGRWLHARNEVKDPERHLRRIRWDAREF